MQKSRSIFSMICVSLLAVTAHANTRPRGYQVVECPRIPTAYSQILNNLSQLKSQIRNDAHCEDVKLQTGELENLVRSERRTRFLEIVRLNGDRSVSADDAEFLRKYAEDASETSLRLMTIMQGKRSCFPDENQGASQLGAVTSFIYEATSLLSRVAGPYGAPIAVGGNILTGVLQGIQAAQASRPGYRFHIAKDRQTFTEQLCIYHSYRRDIDDVLFPDRRIQEIQRLQTILEERLTSLKRSCEECGQIADRFQGRESDEEARRLTAELTATARELDARNNFRLGSETLEAASSLSWAKRERERLEQVRDIKLRSIGPQEVMFLKNDLDHFFFAAQAPNFLTWQTEQSFRADWQFRNAIMAGLSPFIANIAALKNERPSRQLYQTPRNALAYVVENRSLLPEDELAHLESEVLRSRDQFELAWSAWRVIEEYCDFFRDARALNRTLANGHCQRGNMRSQRARLAPRDTLLSLLEPSNWSGHDDKGRESGAFGDFSSSPLPATAPGRAASRPPLANNWIEALEAQQRAWRAAPSH